MAADSVLRSVVSRIALSDPATRGRGKHFTFISPHDILFAFMESSLRRKFILAGWREQKVLTGSRVFIRTPKGVFRTQFRSLRKLEHSLDTQCFLRIHQALLVNVMRLTQLDAAGRLNQVAVAPLDGPVEWLSVSRRIMPILRRMVGLSSRAASSGQSKKPQVRPRRRQAGQRAASRRALARSVRWAR